MREIFLAAMAHHRAGRLAQAEQGYHQVLAAMPKQPDALHMLGVLAWQTGNNEAAFTLIGEAISLHDKNAAYHSNFGLAAKDLGRLAEAESAFRAAARLSPNAAEPLNNLAILFTAQGNWSEALAYSAEALAKNPNLAEAHANIGHVRRQQGNHPEAIACYRAALTLQPDFAEAHTSLAHALLQTGQWREGWAEYEWRWQTRSMQGGLRNIPQPRWRGEPGEGKTLLIHAEQGFGDTIQFCRFAPLAAKLGWQILLEVQPPLARLLSHLPNVQTIPHGTPLPEFHAHTPLLSLPHLLATEAADIPAAPYLQASAAPKPPGKRIGLVWAGSHTVANAEIDKRRSIPPALLSPLLDLPDTNFISLQKDGPPMPPHPNLTNPMPEITDFADTAALIASLDLVISVDTAVAHLAGALGKPVFMLNRFDSCWRWLAGRDDTPWYPTMRIFHQTAPGDWPGVIQRVIAAS